MNRGYIKLWRKSADSESGLMSDPELWTIWCKCLLTAQHESRTIYYFGQSVGLSPGEFIFGYGTWAKHMNLSEKVLRNRIGTLQKRGCIQAVKRAGRITIFSIVKWELYQGGDESEGRETDRETGREMGRHGAGMGQGNKNEENKSSFGITKVIPSRRSLDPGDEEPPNSPPEQQALPVANGAPPCPAEEILSAYHEILPELAAVKILTRKRRQWLQARWREDKKRQNIQWWRQYWQLVKKCPFLMGQNDRAWRADFEWLVNVTNFAKVYEGKYLPKKRKERDGL